MNRWTARAKGYAMILLSALLFGSYGVWSRILGVEFGVFYQGWVRSAFILVVLIPAALIGRHFKRIKRGDQGWFVVTMLFTVFTQAPLYFAYIHLPLGTATFIFYGLFLLTTYAIGWLFLSEKLSPVKIVSFVISLIGLTITFGLSLPVFSAVPMLLAAMNGIASGGEIASSKKLTDRYSSLMVSVYSWIFILITHLPLSLLFGEKQIAPAWNLEWWAMIGYAASGLGGFWLVIEGFKYVDASIGGLIGLLEIIFSFLFGVLFFNDHITLPVIIGGIIILLAAVLPDVYALRHPKEKPIPPTPPI
ncbi:MAG TPA: DMT family transporter [Chlamydiales bacterium]|nr:DMT family transporter [Chlamydiales bacterium]